MTTPVSLRLYRAVTAQLPDYFATRPRVTLPDAKSVTLLELLEAPSLPVAGRRRLRLLVRPHRLVVDYNTIRYNTLITQYNTI